MGQTMSSIVGRCSNSSHRPQTCDQFGSGNHREWYLPRSSDTSLPLLPSERLVPSILEAVGLPQAGHSFQRWAGGIARLL